MCVEAKAVVVRVVGAYGGAIGAEVVWIIKGYASHFLRCVAVKNHAIIAEIVDLNDAGSNRLAELVEFNGSHGLLIFHFHSVQPTFLNDLT